MSTMYAKAYLKYLVGKNQIDHIFEVFRDVNDELPEETQQELLLLGNRYNKLGEDREKGIISQADAQLEHNKILNSLIAMIGEVPVDSVVDRKLVKTQRKKITRKRWLAVGGVLAASALVFWLLQPVGVVPLSAEIHTDRISFVIEQQSTFFKGVEMERLEIQNYSEAWIEGASYQAMGNDTPISLAERLEIEPLDDLEGGPLALGACKVQQLEVPTGTQVTLSKLKGGDPRQLTLDSRGKEPMKGRVSYGGSLPVTLNYALTNLPDLSEVLDPEAITIQCADLGCEAAFTGFSDVSTVTLFPSKKLIQPELGLRINGLRFSRPASGREVSSVLKGSLSLQVPGKAAFREYELKANDELVLDEGNVKIVSLSVKGGSLVVSFAGEFPKAAYGQGLDLHQLAPSRLSWYGYLLFH